MKTGLSYILLDGEELLEDSLTQVKGVYDYINVVLTTKNYLGMKPTKRCLRILKSLHEKGLINKIIKVDCSKQLEFGVKVRNLGISDLEVNGCKLGSIFDVDEFYVKEDLLKVKKILIKEKSKKVIYADLLQYYFNEKYVAVFRPKVKGILKYSDGTRVPVMFKLGPKFQMRYKNPFMVDPRRRLVVKDNEHLLVSPSTCIMYHMWMVRTNIKPKQQQRLKSVHKKSYETWLNWKPGNKCMGLTNQLFDTHKYAAPFILNNFHIYNEST